MPTVAHNRFWGEAAAKTYAAYTWNVDNTTTGDPPVFDRNACSMPQSATFWEDLFKNSTEAWGLRTYLQVS
jgi:hypothetical protein